MSKQEKIVCAAVRYESRCSVRDEPITITIMGVDEDHAIESNIAGYAEPIGNIEMGFMTSHKRFVTPYEALIITGWGNQLRFKDRNYLLPEDLN